MSNVRTVSDTKREFYHLHNRPINSIYRRFVEELLVEIHLLSVNRDFRYDPIFALGVANSFERFMQGYRPEADRQSIFDALCQAVGGNPQKYRDDAMAILEQAKQMSVAELMERLASNRSDEGNVLVATLKDIAQNPQFKYSRLFAVGIYTLLAESDAEVIKDETKRQVILTELSEKLNLAPDKFQKDLDLYRGNLDKFDQLLVAIADTLEADRKKRRPSEASSPEQLSSSNENQTSSSPD